MRVDGSGGLHLHVDGKHQGKVAGGVRPGAHAVFSLRHNGIAKVIIAIQQSHDPIQRNSLAESLPKAYYIFSGIDRKS